jgi:hypothetical protein
MEDPKKIPVQDIIASADLQLFLAAARAFCLFIENLPSEDQVGNLKALQVHLAGLYAKALALKEFYPECTWEKEKAFPSEPHYNRIHKWVGSRLPFQYYWEACEPHCLDKETTALGDLDDDVADIYLDLKNALVNFEPGIPEAREDALWHFHFDFNCHWGQHCISALKAIHAYLENLEK